MQSAGMFSRVQRKLERVLVVTYSLSVADTVARNVLSGRSM